MINLNYYDIIQSNKNYFEDEIVIYNNFYKIPDHPLRKSIKEIKIYDENNKNYDFDLIDNLIFVSNDSNIRLYIRILSTITT